MITLIIVSISIILYLFYYFFWLARKPVLHFNKDVPDSFWNDKLKVPQILKKVWYPPFLLPISHLQNLFYEGIILKSNEIYYDERIELQAEDGGIFAIDIKYPKGVASQSESASNSNSNSCNTSADSQQLKSYRSQFKSLEQYSKTKLNLKLHNDGKPLEISQESVNNIEKFSRNVTLDENNNPSEINDKKFLKISNKSSNQSSSFQSPLETSNINEFFYDSTFAAADAASKSPKTDFTVDEILLIYPGITGKSPDPYIKRLVNSVQTKDFSNKKILTAVMIQRGYDGLDISSSCRRLNGVTNILDLKMALKYLDQRFNKTSREKEGLYQHQAHTPEKVPSKYEDTIINKKEIDNSIKNDHNSKTLSSEQSLQKRSITRIVAFSFGAIQTRLLLGGPNLTAEERRASWYPNSALCNSCPFNLISTTFEKFEVGFAGRFYNRQITKRMSSILDKHNLLPNKIDLKSILSSCKVMRHLDQKINGPAWGFKGWKDYYDAATITPQHLKNMEIPVIFLNSVDDPLIKDAPATDKWFEDTKGVLLVKTQAGGHGAFLRLGWLLKPNIEQRTYFEELFDEWLAMNY